MVSINIWIQRTSSHNKNIKGVYFPVWYFRKQLHISRICYSWIRKNLYINTNILLKNKKYSRKIRKKITWTLSACSAQWYFDEVRIFPEKKITTEQLPTLSITSRLYLVDDYIKTKTSNGLFSSTSIKPNSFTGIIDNTFFTPSHVCK